MNNIRNVAIIAHVDHGKTTLVDALLRQSKTKMGKEMDNAICIMDSNDLEKERGITIFSKNASVEWEGVKVNIIDTPGHADFSGEVERVLTMADGCLLLVDAKEGPMPQTRFVLKKALAMNLKIIVVINKIDKPDARPQYALEKTFDLFLELGAEEAAMDFPVVYASAKKGLAGDTPDLAAMTDIAPLFTSIFKNITPAGGDINAPLQLLVTSIVGDNYKGRIAIGKIYNGKMTAGQEVARISHSGVVSKHRLVALMAFVGLDRVMTEGVQVGDIVALAGIPDVTIGETIADPVNPIQLPVLHIEEPTVKITFRVNDSPFAGKEGDFTTTRQIQGRLDKELETDMALKVEQGANNAWIISGRGELHLAILIERMRRDGYEFQVSRPQVITKEVDGKKLVPYERLYIEVPEMYSGVIMQKMGGRHAEMQNMYTENGTCFLEFLIPTRGLFGYRNEFLTDTKGMGIINSSFDSYQQDPGNWKERDQGSLVAHEAGITNLYGLLNVQDRGVLFLGPAVNVYEGQVVGQNARAGDLRVNVCKTKQLSNMRSKGDGGAEHFNTPRIMGLEDALEYIGDDEMVEVTPKTIRIRKMILSETEERRRILGMIK